MNIQLNFTDWNELINQSTSLLSKHVSYNTIQLFHQYLFTILSTVLSIYNSLQSKDLTSIIFTVLIVYISFLFVKYALSTIYSFIVNLIKLVFFVLIVSVGLFLVTNPAISQHVNNLIKQLS